MHTTTRTTRLLATAATAALMLTACGTTTDEATVADTTDEDDAASDEAVVADPSEQEDDAASEEGEGDGTADEGTDRDEDGEGATAGGDDGDAAVTDPLLVVTATAPDGSTFTIGDALGLPVLVETFATWCSSCRQQLADTQVAAETAGAEVVVLALSVETDLDPASLTAYATENGFEDIRFGVLDEAGVVALADRFGGSVLNPPATPKFRVAPDGTVSGLTTGYESAQEILDSLGA